MENCNVAGTLVETSIKLPKASKEEKVNPTLRKHMLRSLRYLHNTRPDIAYDISLISKYMGNPLQSHLMTTKRILRYVKSTLDIASLFH